MRPYPDKRGKCHHFLQYPSGLTLIILSGPKRSTYFSGFGKADDLNHPLTCVDSKRALGTAFFAAYMVFY